MSTKSPQLFYKCKNFGDEIYCKERKVIIPKIFGTTNGIVPITYMANLLRKLIESTEIWLKKSEVK